MINISLHFSNILAFRRFARGGMRAFGCAAWLFSPAVSAQTNSPGALDPAFSATLNNFSVYAVAVQPDGKVLVGGDFTRLNGLTCNSLARFNANGSADAAFNAGAGADDNVRALAVQTDGHIIIVGDFTSINGAGWHGVARLNEDGSYDASFAQFVGQNGRVMAVAPQPDGKILIGGTFTQVNGVTHNYLARLNANGSLDTSFNAQADSYIYALALRSDGRILAGGDFAKLNNVSHKYVAQLNADGSLDASFTAEMDLTVRALALQTNGQAVIGGSFSEVNGAWQGGVARLNPDGSRDATFTASTSGTVYAVAVQPNGKIIVAGRFSNVNSIARNNLARLNATGQLDLTFDAGAGPDNTVQAMALQSDGELVIGGDFATVNFTDRTHVARLFGDPPAPVQDEAAHIWTAVEVGWDSQAGVQYQVQWSSEAAPAQWQNWGDPVVGTGAAMSVFDSTRNGPRKFYRVVKLPQ